MENYLVKDLMVPISEYATVSEGSTLLDAVLALEKAQEEFDHTKYKHRAVLVLDKKKRVIGKLSHLGVLYALEPKSDEIEKTEELKNYGFSSDIVGNLLRKCRMQGTPFKDLCGKAARLKVEDFMKDTAASECIDENAKLEMAVNQLVTGKHLSLQVTHEGEIVGILRLADVFAAVFHMMKECEIPV